MCDLTFGAVKRVETKVRLDWVCECYNDSDVDCCHGQGFLLFEGACILKTKALSVEYKEISNLNKDCNKNQIFL